MANDLLSLFTAQANAVQAQQAQAATGSKEAFSSALQTAYDLENAQFSDEIDYDEADFETDDSESGALSEPISFGGILEAVSGDADDSAFQ